MSTNNLTLSPDGMSVQLKPEPFKQLSPQKSQLSDSTINSPIFRSDVREEWINAMFGPDFYPRGFNIQQHSQKDASYKPRRQGVGLSGIASYVCFTANIPAVKDDDNTTTTYNNILNSSSTTSEEKQAVGTVQSTTNTATTSSNIAASRGKIGVTLSRIPLGVYVRMVDIESEAYCAGVVPGSVLIDINGMGVLGEPSHKLLERLWVYEGHFAALGSAVELKTENSILKEHPSDGTSPKIKKGIMGPVALKLIKDGVVYTVVLLTGAPFGISWAPAGNFALVQRAYAHAQKAGVTRGCIVAAVNNKSLRDMDHLDTAMELKDQFNTLQDIQISCVYTPAASRTSHNEDQSNHYLKKKQMFPAEIKTIDGVRIRKVNPLKRSTKEETPLEYGVGTFFSCGTGPNYAPTAEGEMITDLISEVAIRVAAGEVLAPTGMKRGLSSIARSSAVSKSTSFADILTDKAMVEQVGKNTTDKRLLMSIIESQSKYMECPPLTWGDMIDRWNYLHSFVFALRMHATSYSMDLFSTAGGMIGTVDSQKLATEFSSSFPLHSTKSTFQLLKSLANMTDSVETIRHNLLQFVSFMSSKVLLAENVLIDEEYKSKEDQESKALVDIDMICGEVVEFLVEMSMKDDDLCQTLHFLLRAYTATYSEMGKDDKSPLSPVKILISAHSHLRETLRRNESGSTPQQPISSPKFSPTNQFKSESLVSFADQDDSSIPALSTKSKSLAKRITGVFKNKKKKRSDTILYQDAVSKSGSFESFPKSFSNTKVQSRPTSILKKTLDQHPKDLGKVLVPGGFSMDVLLDNMSLFLDHLDSVAGMIESTLMKSFGQRITDWAFLPWNDGKNNALGECTNNYRHALQKLNEKKTGFRNKSESHWSPILNPLDSKEVLLSVVPDQSYILPSAHFPLLLTFESAPRNLSAGSLKEDDQNILYRTKVSVASLRGTSSINQKVSYVAHVCVGGTVQETGKSSLDPYYNSTTHRWNEDGNFSFDSSRLRCRPDTIELRVSSIALGGTELDEVGFALVDISKIWNGQIGKKTTYTSKVLSFTNQGNFGQDGLMTDDLITSNENLTVEISVIGEKVPLGYGSLGINSMMPQTRMLLYKHDEDMRQELLAIQFIATCDRILKASGLDLKIKTYGCIPVGSNKGFIEWVPGALSLSELCKPVGAYNADKNVGGDTPFEAPDAPSTAFQRTGGWCTYESLRSLRNKCKTSKNNGIGLSGENPLQEFLRSNAYDENAPYFIKKEVMDTFLKSCAGYCVITYLLGVGDRHTDNLLLHPRGYFFHCDYSFILGQDPKTYLPMRITSQMIDAMGGKDSDNFAKFLSLVGAAFVALRQPSSVRILMSMLKGMVDAKIPDISINQKPENALRLFHERFCLHLNDNDAVLFLEENITRSSTSKLWIAVDALHSLGKKF